MNGCIRFAKEAVLGFAAPFRGTVLFLRHPRWWLLGLPSLVIAVLLAVLAAVAVDAVLTSQFLPEEGSPASVLVTVTAIVCGLGMLCMLPIVYGIFGELFFDSLTVRTRLLLYGLGDASPGFWESLRRSGPAIRYALVSVLLYAVLCLPAFFAPMGIFLLECFFAYRMGVTYLLNAGAAGGETVEATLAWVRGNRGRVLGFGVGVHLLMLIPLVNIPGLPGVLIGAVMARGAVSAERAVKRRQ